MASANINQLSWFALLSLSLLFAWASAATDRLPYNDDKEMADRHERWIATYSRVYKDAAEKEHRFKIFRKNVEYIESVNRAVERKYKLRMNKFTDMSSEEFIGSHTGILLRFSSGPTLTTSFRYENLTDVPDSIDWRAQGAVTPIKDQGGCGCCWAFAAVAAMEGMNQIKTGSMISLSEQEIVDCDVNGDDHGCGGGLPENAFKFIMSNGGLETEDNYPYQAEQGACKSTAANTVTIAEYEEVPQNSESSLLKAVSQQPVSIGIEASDDFQHYGSGVFTGTCGTNLNHAVTIVGYGTETDGTKYWLVKNQWGTSWGENGYMKIQRDVTAPEGLCGIAMQASYPIA